MFVLYPNRYLQHQCVTQLPMTDVQTATGQLGVGQRISHLTRLVGEVEARISDMMVRLPSGRRTGELKALREQHHTLKNRLAQLRQQRYQAMLAASQTPWCRIVRSPHEAYYRSVFNLDAADEIFVIVDIVPSGHPALSDPQLQGQWYPLQRFSSKLTKNNPAGLWIEGFHSVRVLRLDWNLDLMSLIAESLDQLARRFDLDMTARGSQNLRMIEEAQRQYAELDRRSQQQIADETFAAIYPAHGPAPADFLGNPEHQTLPFYLDVHEELCQHHTFQMIGHRTWIAVFSESEQSRRDEVERLWSYHLEECYKLAKSYYRNVARWYGLSVPGQQDGPLGPILHRTYRQDMQRLIRGPTQATSLRKSMRSLFQQIKTIRESLGISADAARFSDPAAAAEHVQTQGIACLREYQARVKLQIAVINLYTRLLYSGKKSSSKTRKQPAGRFGPGGQNRVRRARELVRLADEFKDAKLREEELREQLSELADKRFTGPDEAPPKDDDFDSHVLKLLKNTESDVDFSRETDELAKVRQDAWTTEVERATRWPALNREQSQRVARSILKLQDQVVSLQTELLTAAQPVLEELGETAAFWELSESAQHGEMLRVAEWALQRGLFQVIASGHLQVMPKCLQALEAQASMAEVAMICGNSPASGGQSIFQCLNDACPRAFFTSFLENLASEDLSNVSEELSGTLGHDGDGWSATQYGTLLLCAIVARRPYCLKDVEKLHGGYLMVSPGPTAAMLAGCLAMAIHDRNMPRSKPDAEV